MKSLNYYVGKFAHSLYSIFALDEFS